jgi:protein-tyrosine phosphatase
VIDLHSHILPGLDDGAGNLEASLSMALMAVEEGIDTIVATPHVNQAYPVDPDAMSAAVGALNVALARMELPLAVLPGSEIAVEMVSGLDDIALRRLSLGGGGCLLVESPYSGSVPFLEDMLFDLQVRGFRPVLAHPERSIAFRERPERLAGLVSRGVMSCVNSGSLAGRFGTNAKRMSLQFFQDGLVHAVASDSHDDRGRPPRLLEGFQKAEEELPGIAAQAEWFTSTAPAAIVAGGRLPERPASPVPPVTGWRRFMRKH